MPTRYERVPGKFSGTLFSYVALARRVHNVHETKEPPAMRVRIGGYTKKDLFLLQ